MAHIVAPALRHDKLACPGLCRASLVDLLAIPLPDSATSHITPRQFRRFGAALWAYRFDLPVASLSVALNHFDYIVTSTYLKFRDFREWAEKYSRRLTLEIVEAAAAGSNEFSGIQSKRFRRIRDRLRSSINASAVPAELRIAQYISEERGIIANPTPWGFCLCSADPQAIVRSACKIEGAFVALEDGRPDSSASSAGICCGCKYFMARANRLKYLESEQQKTRHLADDERHSVEVRTNATRRVIYLTRVIDDLKNSQDK